MKKAQNPVDILKIINAESTDPYSVLGMHAIKDEGLIVRAFLPNAENIKMIKDSDNSGYPMEKTHESGLFEVFIKGEREFFTYSLEVTDKTGTCFKVHDPYSFMPVLTDFDMHLFNEGTHHEIYEKLGSHIMTVDGIKGTLFATWAPCALRVSVVGDFNQWDGRRHQMRCLGCSGVWEIFIPEAGQGDRYKYEIKTRNDGIYIKSDPYAFYAELRPGTASIVHDISGYEWRDASWIKERDMSNIYRKPISIYEVHLGSWARVSEEDNRFLTYREMADRLVSYIKEMGFTHVEFLPVSEHPFDGSWGYQVTGYYAITSRYGTPEDFMFLVDELHKNGIGVIVDWVPAHFPKDAHGLARFDGTAAYEHANPKQGEHPDWGTLIFNYGRNEVRSFLVSNAVFLFKEYHIDGLRVDAVASMLYLDYGKKKGEWIPNKYGGHENIEAVEFLRHLNSTVYSYFPGIMMIAEESTSWAQVTKPPFTGGLGFSFKWNMGWMNDFLRYISMDPVYRKYHHNYLTFSIMYAMSENYIQVLSHDEVVHGKCSMIGKMPGDYWQKFAGLRVSYGYMFGHPGKKLMFMGNEIGQFIEWNYQNSIDWNLLDYEMHKKLQYYIKDLNKLYTSEKAMHQIDFDYEGFEWIDCNDYDHSIISFIRKGQDCEDTLIFVCNFTPVVHNSYRIGVPFDLFYKEVFNSDSDIYGGSNVGNMGGLQAEQVACHGRQYSLGIQIPPLAMVVFKPVFEKKSAIASEDADDKE